MVSISEMFPLAQTTVRRAEEQATSHEVERAVRDHSRLVFQVAYSVLRNRDEAEDAAQETFLRLLRYQGKLEQARNPRAFLARIAWNVAIDRIRKRKRLAEISLNESDEETAAEPVRAMRSRGLSPEQLAAATEMQALIGRLIETLPRKLRDAFTLSTVEEMRSAEIAEILGIPEASVRTRLFRARGLLREKLSALLGSGE